jgi:hypothetical protein
MILIGSNKLNDILEETVYCKHCDYQISLLNYIFDNVTFAEENECPCCEGEDE